MRWTLLLLVLLTAAPMGGAQTSDGPIPAQLELVVNDHPAPVDPGGAPAVYGWTVTLYTDAQAHGEVEVELVPPEDTEHWRFRLSPANVTLTMEPEIGSELGRTYNASGTMTVLASPNAPAFQTQSFQLLARTQGNTLISSAEATTAFVAIPNWRPGLQVTAQPAVVPVEADGGQGTALAELLNTGNGNARVTPEVVQTPQGCAVEASPAPVVLQAMDRASVSIPLDCDRGWDRGQLVVRFDHRYALDEKLRGSPVEAVWDVLRPGDNASADSRTFGDPSQADFSNDAPVPAWGALVAVGLALMVRGRRG